MAAIHDDSGRKEAPPLDNNEDPLAENNNTASSTTMHDSERKEAPALDNDDQNNDRSSSINKIPNKGSNNTRGTTSIGKVSRGKGSSKKARVRDRVTEDKHTNEEHLDEEKDDSVLEVERDHDFGDDARKNSKRNGAGRGRGRRRSSPFRQSSYTDEDGVTSTADGEDYTEYGFLSVESRTRKIRSRPTPQTQLEIVNEEEKYRLTNPLLAMVPANFRKAQNDLNKKNQRDLINAVNNRTGGGRNMPSGQLMAGAAASVARSTSKGGKGRRQVTDPEKCSDNNNHSEDSNNTGSSEEHPHTANVTGMIPVGEIMNSASIVFHRPNTYPLSFLARLLGFDVDVPDCTNMLLPSGGEQKQSTPGESKVNNNNNPRTISDSVWPSEIQSTLPRFPTPMPDPQTLPLRKDKVFLKIPPEGTYFRYRQQGRSKTSSGSNKNNSKNRLGDWDDRRVLDYMDPVYKSFLQYGWESRRCTAVRREKSTKFIAEQKQQEPIRQQVAELAQEILGLSKDWTFQDWGSFQSQLQREEKEQAKVTASLENDVATAAADSANDQSKSEENGKESSIPGSSPLQQHRRPRRQNGGLLWTIDGKHVFSRMPQHVFGILALYRGQPIALLKYQFYWYTFPASSTRTQNQNEYEKKDDELIMVIQGIGYRTSSNEIGSDCVNHSVVGANDGEQRSGGKKGSANPTTQSNTSSSMTAAVIVTESSAKESKNKSLEYQNQKIEEVKQVISDGDERKAHPLPIMAELNDMVRVVMLALALEHTRACGLLYGIWETPESFVEKNRNCFRMANFHRNDSVEVPKEGRNTGNNPKGDDQKTGGATEWDTPRTGIFQPMICDLKKCSSRLAMLKLKEDKDSDVTGTTTKSESGIGKPATIGNEDFISSPERLLVEMPSFEKARTFFKGPSMNAEYRHLRRGLDAESTSTNIFSDATGDTREILLKLRAKIDASNENQVDVYKVDSGSGCEFETPLQLWLPTRKATAQTGQGKTKESKDSAKESENNEVIDIHLNKNKHQSHMAWNLLRCFPIEDKIIHSIAEAENEVLNRLTKKQDELIVMEKLLEPHVRRLLAKAKEERMEYESSESRQRRRDTERILMEFEDYLLKRKEIDQVRQELREEDMDAVCSICDDGDVTPDNQILFCESCNVAVHQQCYGVEKIPEGDYYCIACRHYERDKMIQSMSETSRLQARADLPPLPIVCELCPSKNGAFTRLKNLKTESDPSDAKWVHMTCAKWQGLDFVDKGDASLVEDVTKLKQLYRRNNISCCICKGMRGAYIQCREKGCENWCHITCARESGLCEVVHGEDVKGNAIENNPWTIRCPDHSTVDKKQKNMKRVEELIKASKDFPDEPKPPPLLKELGPYNKLTGKERKMALSVREYEDKYIADILKTKFAGVRCEVCDTIEDIHGRNLCRCEVCGSVICHTCELFSENPGQRSFKCYGCSSRSKQEDENEPQCGMCHQKGGLLVKATSFPMLKQGYWNKNPKEFQRSLFKKAEWAHILCA